MTYDEFWTLVFGVANCEDLVRQYDLDDDTIAMWVIEVTLAAWYAHGGGYQDLPDVWVDHADRATCELRWAIADARCAHVGRCSFT